MLKRYLIATGIVAGLAVLTAAFMSLFFGGFYLAVIAGKPVMGWTMVGLFFWISVSLMTGIIAHSFPQEEQKTS